MSNSWAQSDLSLTIVSQFRVAFCAVFGDEETSGPGTRWKLDGGGREPQGSLLRTLYNTMIYGGRGDSPRVVKPVARC